MLKTIVLLCRISLVCCFSIAIIGCGPGTPKDMPKTYPCKITVTKGGSPVEGATVLLTSSGYPGSLSVTGKTDSSGVAVIQSSYAAHVATGAPAGDAKVVVQKTPDIPDSVRKPKEEVAKMTPPEQNAYAAELAKAMAAAPKIVPQSLSSPATTPITVAVKEDKSAGTEMSVELEDYKK